MCMFIQKSSLYQFKRPDMPEERLELLTELKRRVKSGWPYPESLVPVRVSASGACVGWDVYRCL